MHYVGLMNQKGGTGKSTIAVHLAGALGQKGWYVVLVDSDPQGTSAAWAVHERLEFLVVHQPIQESASPEEIDNWLDFVQSVATGEGIVVIDAPPFLGRTAAVVAGMADLCLVPVTASPADIHATVRAVDLIQAAREGRADEKPKCLLVPNRIDNRTAAAREIAPALAEFGEPVGPPIRQAIAFSDAFSEGETIGQFDPNSKAAHDVSKLADAVVRQGRFGKPPAKKGFKL